MKLKFKNPKVRVEDESWFDFDKWKPDWNSIQDSDLTPMENTMVTQDILDGSDGLFIENSEQFMKDMEKINEMGYIFMGLGLLFALASLLIYRRLKQNEGMKVDFSAARRKNE